MRTIREVKKVIRVELGNGNFLDFDPNSYSGESDAYLHYEDVRSENPRMYKGTITTELEEVE